MWRTRFYQNLGRGMHYTCILRNQEGSGRENDRKVTRTRSSVHDEMMLAWPGARYVTNPKLVSSAQPFGIHSDLSRDGAQCQRSTIHLVTNDEDSANSRQSHTARQAHTIAPASSNNNPTPPLSATGASIRPRLIESPQPTLPRLRVYTYNNSP